MAADVTPIGTPALELTTRDPSERIPIKIDGVTYGLSHGDDLPWLAMDFVDRSMKRFEVLQQQDHYTEDEEREVSQRLRRMVRLICDAPAPVIDKLTDFQVLAICEVFSTLRAASRPSNGATPQTATTNGHPSGPNSSVGSPGSIPGRPRRTGARRRRSRN